MIYLSLLCGRPEVFLADCSFEISQSCALPCARVTHAGFLIHLHSGFATGVIDPGPSLQGGPVMIIICFKYNTPLKNCDSEAIQECKSIF